MGKALFLDLDGTLADSLPVMRAVYGRFLAGFGRPASDAEFDGLNGPPLPEVVRRLKATHDLPGEVNDLAARYRSLVDEAYDQVAPMPGARELLRKARTGGWTVGVVTSGADRRTREWLARVGLASWVDVVVAGEDVRRGKPDPEPYRVALARAACPADRAVAIEDSVPGARAARAAGLMTFGLVHDRGRPPAWPPGVRAVAALTEIPSLIGL